MQVDLSKMKGSSYLPLSVPQASEAFSNTIFRLEQNAVKIFGKPGFLHKDSIGYAALRTLLLPAMEKADRSLWKISLIEEATQGAEKFVGQYAEMPILDKPQWWMFDCDYVLTAFPYDFGWEKINWDSVLFWPEGSTSLIFTSVFYPIIRYEESGPRFVDYEDVCPVIMPCRYDWAEPLVEATAWLLLALEFLNLRIVEQVSTQVGSRAERRRLVRMGKSPPKPISIIHLRHEQSDYQSDIQSHSPVNWSCQWEVSPHWRSQPCGERNKFRKPVFIHRYVKGPKDKPFRPKLFKIDR